MLTIDEQEPRQSAAAPIGQHVTVPSSLTGRPLTYFIPDPITELASRLAPAVKRNAHDNKIVPEAAWLLVPYLTRSAVDTSTSSPALVELYRQVLLGQRALRTVDDLIRLANEITPRARHLRQQMAYAGGPTPSTAEILYAPASAVPALVDSLFEFLASDLTGWEPAEVAALVGYCAVHAHPFEDGNGRWSRLLSAYAGTLAGRHWDGIAVATFQKACKVHLISLWASARYAGLSTYFEDAKRFSLQLRKDCELVGIPNVVRDIVEVLRTRVERGAAASRLAFDLFTKGFLQESELRRLLGCSRKKASSILQELVNGREDNVGWSDAGISIVVLQERIANIVKELQATFSETSGEGS